MIIETVHFIDAAHQLPDSDDLFTKKCAQLHGHTYKIKIGIEGNNSQSGMVIDFGAVKEVVNKLDHRYINDVFHEKGWDVPSTAENISRYIAEEIFVELGFTPTHVAVCEGYKGEENSNYVTYFPGR